MQNSLQRAAATVLVAAVAVLMALWVVPHVPRTDRITMSPGGEVHGFIQLFSEWRNRGDRVVIDGPCFSACAMVTGLIPPERLCVTPYAVLGFHSAYTMPKKDGEPQHSSEGTRVGWHTYPENVRALLRSKGWNGDDAKTNKHPDLIYVEGDELTKLIHPCKEN
jgi:hypothetical protein